jgi:hypothetical protein
VGSVKFVKIDTEGHDHIILRSYLEICKSYPELYADKIQFEYNESSNKEELDSIKVNYYKKFILKCKTAGIILNVIHTPKYYKLKNNDTSIEKAIEIAGIYQIPFYDLANDSMYLSHPNLFSDPYHLNN